MVEASETVVMETMGATRTAGLAVPPPATAAPTAFLLAAVIASGRARTLISLSSSSRFTLVVAGFVGVGSGDGKRGAGLSPSGEVTSVMFPPSTSDRTGLWPKLGTELSLELTE